MGKDRLNRFAHLYINQNSSLNYEEVIDEYYKANHRLSFVWFVFVHPWRCPPTWPFLTWPFPRCRPAIPKVRYSDTVPTFAISNELTYPTAWRTSETTQPTIGGGTRLVGVVIRYFLTSELEGRSNGISFLFVPVNMMLSSGVINPPSSRSAREVVGPPDPILAGFDCAMTIPTGSRRSPGVSGLFKQE